MFCGHCGKRIDDNSFFCKYCGQAIETPITEETTKIREEQSSPQVPRRRGKRLLFGYEKAMIAGIVAVAAIVLTVVIGILIGHAVNSNKAAVATALPAPDPEPMTEYDMETVAEPEEYDETEQPYTEDDSYLNEEEEVKPLPENIFNEFKWGFTDDKGYTFEMDLVLSQLIAAEAPLTLEQAWNALGGSMDEIPDIEDCKKASVWWRSKNYETGYYIVGTITVNNLTDNFSFSPDKTYKLWEYTSGKLNYGFSTGFLINEKADRFYLLNQGLLKCFTNPPQTILQYANDNVLESDGRINVPYPIMDSDQWGPIRFIMAMPNSISPNEPNGKVEFDNCYFTTFNGTEDDFNRRYYGDYSTIKLEKIERD